ncbi:MAG: large-conductance mechanosensitive channel protein MscL [Polyangiaceae bacterium]|nr:large-conductance mechanosensitive channel protein MscL [Polyangiaceae bacterium]
MKLVQEFKEFAVKGNVVDMAVGVIIGAAFGKIVSSFVADVVTPPLGLLVGGVDFTGLTVVLREAGEGKAAVVLKYGVFLQTVFDFLLVGWAIFMMVKLVNRLRRDPPKPPAPPPEPPPPTRDQELLGEIRDLLRARNAK